MDGERLKIIGRAEPEGRGDPLPRRKAFVVPEECFQLPMDLATGLVFGALWSDAEERHAKIIVNTKAIAARLGRDDGPVRRSLKKLEALGLVRKIDHDGRRGLYEVFDPAEILAGRIVRPPHDEQRELDLAVADDDEGEVADVVRFELPQAGGQNEADNVRQPDKIGGKMSGSYDHDHEEINTNHDHESSEGDKNEAKLSAAPLPDRVATSKADAAEPTVIAEPSAPTLSAAERELVESLERKRMRLGIGSLDPDGIGAAAAQRVERETKPPAKANRARAPDDVGASSSGDALPVAAANLADELQRRVGDRRTVRPLFEKLASAIVQKRIPFERVKDELARLDELPTKPRSRGAVFFSEIRKLVEL